MRILKKNPLLKGVNHYLIDSPQPSNISYWWNIGSLLGLCLGMQLITGVFLAMHYNSSVSEAFNSVEHIMRDVNYGWFIRYMHANGASAFFFLVYLHIGRGFYYGSYKNPSTLTWIIGTFIFILMMATAFLGYVLPYGQMSLWGATVITNLMSAIPWIGKDIVEFIWGGFSVNNATLNRFFALHYLLPFVIAALALFHLIVLHDKGGSNNPLGLSGNYDRIPMAPYFLFKDLITIFIFMLVFSVFIFFSPNYLGDSENYVMANPMQTPPAIVPEWYLLPFYAILRSIPNKLLGVIAMFSAILALLSLPFTDRGITRGLEFKPMNKIMFFIFIANFFILMILGAKHVETPFIELGQVCTLIYFAYFGLVIFFSLQENALGELTKTNTKKGISNFPLKLKGKLKSFNCSSFRERISLSFAFYLLKREIEQSPLISVFTCLYWYGFKLWFGRKITPLLLKTSRACRKIFLPIWKVVGPVVRLPKMVGIKISSLLGEKRTAKLKRFLTRLFAFKVLISIIWVCYDTWDIYSNWGSHQIMSVRKYINLNPAGNVQRVYPPDAWDIHAGKPWWWQHMLFVEINKFQRNQQIEMYNQITAVLSEKSQACREWGRWLVRLKKEQLDMFYDSPHSSSGTYANVRKTLATIEANVDQLKCNDAYNAALQKHFAALGNKKPTFDDIALIHAKATLDEIDFKIALAKAKASAPPVTDIASRPRIQISDEIYAFTKKDGKKYIEGRFEPRPWEKY